MYKSMCEEEGEERREGSGAWGFGSKAAGAVVQVGIADGLAGTCVCVHTRVHACERVCACPHQGRVQPPMSCRLSMSCGSSRTC